MQPALNKGTYYAIGLMSGSSLDGLDIVYASFSLDKIWSFDILAHKTAPLGIWETKLKHVNDLCTKDLQKLSGEFGVFLAEQTALFINEHRIQDIDIIASHGHTVYHYPTQKKTCQIGDGKRMAERLKIPVLSNLRQADMDAGGQGAPIVPIGDLHLFRDCKFCLNLGGIANVSIKQNNEILAYDIAMANQILNHYSQKLGKNYDHEGQLAAQGTVNDTLLQALNTLDFYQKAAPKSLDNAYKNEVIACIESYNESPQNILATYTLHLAKQIAFEVQKFSAHKEDKILISGGGAFNSHLIELLKQELSCQVVVPDSTIINYKEALVMGFMAVLFLQQKSNVLASVTGAERDTICGELADST